MHGDTGAMTAVCVSLIMWINICAGLGLKHTENQVGYMPPIDPLLRLHQCLDEF